VAATGNIRFFKMTGSGNDFIIIDNRSLALNADQCRDLVRRACRRKLSVGADGLILIENDPEADFKWRFFNADGSEAEMCGNGARCAARFARLKGIVNKTQMSFRTLAGIIQAEIKGERVKIRMTPPHGLAVDLSLDADEQTFRLHFVNTGVPHVVTFVEDEAKLEDIDVFRWGRAFRYHPHFQPAGTNVNFALVRDNHHLAVRTYERGVEDETLACGTGCIASALIAAAKQFTDSPVEVQTRSGETLTIYFQTARQQTAVGETRFAEVYLEGDAKVVYEAELWDETIRD
jgi:diaminopimelate epimerase